MARFRCKSPKVLGDSETLDPSGSGNLRGGSHARCSADILDGWSLGVHLWEAAAKFSQDRLLGIGAGKIDELVGVVALVE